MPWKKGNDGQVVVENGNPIFVHPDGREEQFNGDSTLIRIGELKNEAKGYRQKHSELKKRVQPFLDANIEDAEDYFVKANEAISLVETYKEKGTPGSEEIEKIKQSVAKTFEVRFNEKNKLHKKEIKDLTETIKTKDEAIKKQLVKSEFDTSQFIRDKTNMIPEMAYIYFGKNFMVEEKNGTLTPYALDMNGEKIFSLNGSGYAAPQEAIEILVKSHPKKAELLKSGAGGSGAQGGSKGLPFTGKTIEASDMQAASRNIEKIAKGEVVVTQ